jgi:hypothetical protein
VWGRVRVRGIYLRKIEPASGFVPARSWLPAMACVPLGWDHELWDKNEGGYLVKGVPA